MSKAQEVNQTEFAAIVGLSTRQVRNLEAEGLPHRAKGNKKLYPIPDALAWYYARKFEPEELTDTAEAKRRKLTAEAKLAEIEVAKAAGELVPLDQYTSEMGLVLDKVRAKLQNVPGAWAPALVGCKGVPEALTRLRPLVNEILVELSSMGDELEELDVDDAA